MGKTFKVNYKEDSAFFQNTWVKTWLGILIALMIVSGLFLDPYALSILNEMAIAVIGAIGLNLLIGYTGQISLGHGAFVAIGAYTSALLTGKLGFPFFLSLPLSGFMAAALGMIVGIPSSRLKGLYLALGTLAFSFIIEYVLFHWNMTQGDLGMAVKPIGLGLQFVSTVRSGRMCARLVRARPAIWRKAPPTNQPPAPSGRTERMAPLTWGSTGVASPEKMLKRPPRPPLGAMDLKSPPR